MKHEVAKAVQVSSRLLAWKMPESAALVLEQALAANPCNPDLLRRLGRLKLRQGQAAEAVPYLKMALAHDKLMHKFRQPGEVPRNGLAGALRGARKPATMPSGRSHQLARR